MEQTKLDRINALYKKSKESGLTEEEKNEQKILRKEYVQLAVGNLRQTLENTSIKELDGTITPLTKEPNATDKNYH